MAITQQDAPIISSPSAMPSLSLVDELIVPENKRVRSAAAVIALCVAIVSVVLIGPWASSAKSYPSTISSLDEKKASVMRLIAGSTTTSAAITLLPGDVGTPIAEKLLDLGGNFAIVLGAIYLEKYLLSILGGLSFFILVPCACVLFAISMPCVHKRWLGQALRRAGGRLALFGLLVFLLIPSSVFVTQAIDETYKASVEETLAQAEEMAHQAETQAHSSSETSSENSSSGILGFIQGIPEAISTTAQGVSRDAQNTLNTFIETFAVMIVTSCVIPICVLVLFILLAKLILGLKIDMNKMSLLGESLLFRRRV